MSESKSELVASGATRPVALHLRPTAELAERVLLPGDPGRALALAQKLIAAPRMFNHHRGLWGYSGLALADGEPLTIQATGMGGPSAAIVLSELIALGARRAVRVGTCGALATELELGDLVIAADALCRDGASRALAVGGELGGSGERETNGEPSEPRALADTRLTAALAGAAPPGTRVGSVVSVDLFYEDVADTRGPAGAVTAAPVLAIEMESATLFAVGARAGIQVGSVLAVSDVFDVAGARTRIDDQTLLSAAETMGAAAVAALRTAATE